MREKCRRLQVPRDIGRSAMGSAALRAGAIADGLEWVFRAIYQNPLMLYQ
jgi:hypothetical protein